jgi:streptogramin lyase
MTYGPDGNLYVSSWGNGSVVRYDGTTGAFINDFVPSGRGGLSHPDRVEFGPDGKLYVSDRFAATIRRYNGTTGAFIDNFASDGRLGGFTGFTFGPDGNIYAGEYNGNFDVLRFNGQTGALMGIFSHGAGGLVSISGITFGPDGNLYVAGLNSDNVIRYNGTTGAFMDVFVPPAANTHIGANVVFGPDGNLYTTNDSSTTPSVLGYDGTTGAFVGVAASGGLVSGSPRGIAFQAATATPSVSIADASVTENPHGTRYLSFDVTLSGPSNRTVTVHVGTAPGTATPGIDYVGKAATKTFLPGQTTQHFRVHILNDQPTGQNEQFFVNIDSPTGATIADGQAVGTILESGGGASAQQGNQSGSGPSSSVSTLLLGDPGDNSVKLYDPATGTFLGDFVAPGSGGLSVPQYMNFGPDGNLYVSSWGNGRVLRYDGTTGAFLDAFVAPGSGGLSHPDRVEFGPDGNLYVSDRFAATIRRYNGTTGAFMDNFASDGRLGGFTGFTFGPDGNLYAGEYNGNFDVLRFNGKTGALMGIFAHGAGGIVSISGINFGPDGNLYVGGNNSAVVARYNGTTGAFIDDFIPSHLGGLSGVANLVFGPDGNLYVTKDSSSTPGVLCFDGTTGAFLGVAASGGGLGPDPRGIAFPQGGTSGPAVSIADASVTENPHGTRYLSFDVTLSGPSNRTVTVHVGTAAGTATPGIDFVGKDATKTFLPGQTIQHFRVHILNDQPSGQNEQFFVNLSNATGATIADGQAVGTILESSGSAPAPRSSTPAPSLAGSATPALANDQGTIAAGLVASLPAHRGQVVTVPYSPVSCGVDSVGRHGTPPLLSGPTTPLRKGTHAALADRHAADVLFATDEGETGF